MIGKYRYEFRRISKNGVPCLQVLDNYLAPLVINEYLFKHEGVKELNGYGAQMIDKILDILKQKDTNPGVVTHIVMSESMSRIKKALDDLGDAMEEYDHRTGSKSGFSFTSIPIKGDVFTSEIKNSLILQNNSADGWILVKNDLPPANTVIWGFNEQWIDEDFNPEGVRECLMGEDEEWNTAKWDNDNDNWHNESTWGEKGHAWVGVAPTHWMPLPKPPIKNNSDKK